MSTALSSSNPDSSPRPVVIVSGGGTGIGYAVARRFVDDGARVFITGRREQVLREAADQLGAQALPADVSDARGAQSVIDRVLADEDRIDVIVANAGGGGLSDAAGTSDAEWEAALTSNVTTAFALVRSGLDALERSRGRVVIVSSLAGIFAGPEVTGYTVGKHALIGLTRSIARDYGPRGIRVNAVCPGWVRTPMANGEMDELVALGGAEDRDDGYRQVTKDVPLGRPAEPREIAGVVRFLASEDSSYMTGGVLVVDGGAHIVDVPTIPIAHALADASR